MKNKSFISKIDWLKCSSVIKCAEELQTIINNKNPKILRKYLQNVNDCVINAISEIALNVSKGKVPLSPDIFKKLNNKRDIIRKLSSNKLSNKSRRNLIIQKGGFLPLLIKPALLLFSSVLGEFIGKKVLQ